MNAAYNALLGALIGLARAAENKELSNEAGDALVDGLAMAFSSGYSAETEPGNPVFDRASEQEITFMINRLHTEKDHMAPDCAACQYPCGRTFDYNMEELYGSEESLKRAKLKLFEILGQIALQSHLSTQNSTRQFLSEALFQISCTYEPDQLSAPLKHAEKLLTAPQ